MCFCVSPPCDEQPEHGILVPNYEVDRDPEKKDAELTKLIPFLKYVSSVADMSAELGTYAGTDLADAFEKKLPQLIKEGKVRPAGRGGRPAGPPRPGGATVWDRLLSR